jgi:hypothetical protein
MLANAALFVFGTRRRVSELPEKFGRFEQVHRVSFDHESNLVKTPFELSAGRPLRSSLGEETGVEDEDSGMLLHAACGKQDRGDSGASMPETKRGSGLGDRSHGGEIAERRRPRPR